MLSLDEKNNYFNFLKKATMEDIKDFIVSKSNKEEYLFQGIRNLPILSHDKETVLDIIYDRNDNDMLKMIINIYSEYDQSWSINNNNSLLKRAINDSRKELIKYLTQDLSIGLTPQESYEFFKKSDIDTLCMLIKEDILYKDMFSLSSLIINPEYNMYFKLTFQQNINENIMNNLKFVAEYFENDTSQILLNIYKKGDPQKSPLMNLFKSIYEDENILFRSGKCGDSLLKYMIEYNEFALIESLIKDNELMLDIRTIDKKTLWDVFKDIDLGIKALDFYVSDDLKKYVEQMKRIDERFMIEDAMGSGDVAKIRNKKRI